MTILGGLAAVPLWPILLVFGYPVLAVLLFEAARRVGTDRPVAANVLRQILYLVSGGMQSPSGGDMRNPATPA
jgi:hypothetical protein